MPRWLTIGITFDSAETKRASSRAQRTLRTFTMLDIVRHVLVPRLMPLTADVSLPDVACCRERWPAGKVTIEVLDERIALTLIAR